MSMVAAHLVAKDKDLDDNNVFPVDADLKLLKSAAIYGANASGKSNLAKALGFMRWFMINSSKETQSTEKIGVEPFTLSTTTDTQPTFFEIVFLMDDRKYRYGFEATADQIVSEWLFYVPKSRETRLFERKFNDFTISRTYKADGVQQRTRQNALFLSVSAQFNVEIAESILSYLTHNINIISGLHDETYLSYTIRCLKDSQSRHEILQLLEKLDLGFSDIKIKNIKVTDPLLDKLPDEIKKLILSHEEGDLTAVQTVHQKFDEAELPISTELFDLRHQESEGTQKVFALAGSLVDTLKHGEVLIIDEFDARIHPLLSQAIVKLFNSNITNPNNAQLVVMTHDTNLLSNKLFRRDQIWFTEKSRYGATDLYSLAEYKVRNDASFESDYIKGKYGAIPYISNLNPVIDTVTVQGCTKLVRFSPPIEG